MNNSFSFNDLIPFKDRQTIKLGLERIKSCLEYLDNPQEKYKSIIIGGTNGKGSVTFYLSNLLCTFTDYKIGRYISPHLISWNERYVINESIINNSLLKETSIEVAKKIRDFETKTNNLLTEFEIYTVIAFYLFAKEKVDMVCLEVGIGGRLDATNVASSKNTLCSIITNVSFDHTGILGERIEKIAFEKAGIIKKNNHIVTGVTQEAALKVIKDKAKDLNSTLYLVNTEDLLYPDKNIEIALKAWEIISSQIQTTNNNINKKDYLKSLQFPGRFHFFEDKKILLDGAHNPQAASELRKLLEKKFSSKKIIYIIGILDKDYKSFITNLIPENSYVICTEPKSSRATKKEILADFVQKNGSNTVIAHDLNNAINKAQKKDYDLIVITGSLYLIGEALTLISNNQIKEIVLN